MFLLVAQWFWLLGNATALAGKRETTKQVFWWWKQWSDLGNSIKNNSLDDFAYIKQLLEGECFARAFAPIMQFTVSSICLVFKLLEITVSFSKAFIRESISHVLFESWIIETLFSIQSK